jgi:hypothetical protein
MATGLQTECGQGLDSEMLGGSTIRSASLRCNPPRAHLKHLFRHRVPPGGWPRSPSVIQTTMKGVGSLAFGDRGYRYDASDDFNCGARCIYDAALACLLSAASAQPSIFTGKEHDSESGNDYR